MKQKLILLINSFFVTFSLFFRIDYFYKENYSNLINNLFLVPIFFIIIYCIFNKKKRDQSNIFIDALGISLSLLCVFGYSYYKFSSAILIFGNIYLFLLSFIIAIGYFILFRYLLSYIFNYFDKLSLRDILKNNKFFEFFNKHIFLFSLSFIIICWLPYIIAFYPAILSPDPSFQIMQFFGIWTKYNEYSVMIDPSVIITNHHPVLHTLILGGCVNIGKLLNNINFGLFLCSLIQIIFLSTTFAYSIKYLRELKISIKYCFIILLIYALVPMFPFYSMSLVKDVIFSCFVMWFIIYLHRILKGFKVNYILYSLIIIGTILFRHNGYHILIFTFVLMFFMFRKKWKFVLISLLSIILVYNCYNKVILPAFHVTPGSVREILSVPFQQMARTYKEHKNGFDEDDLSVIDNILDISDLDTRYDESISDPVKNKFNKYTTDDELMEYFGVWLKYLFKYPVTYIDATVNNVYGYFYPLKTNWYIYHKYDTRIVDKGFDYHYNSLSDMRKVLSDFGVSYPKIPIIGLISNIGFNVWGLFVLLTYSLYKKKYNALTLLLPSFGLLLICILSPVNCYFRYALPFIFAIPFMFGLFIDLVKDDVYEESRK